MADQKMPPVRVFNSGHWTGDVNLADLAAFVDAHVDARLRDLGAIWRDTHRLTRNDEQPTWHDLAESIEHWLGAPDEPLAQRVSAELDALRKRCAELEAGYPDKMADAHGRGQEDGFRAGVEAAIREYIRGDQVPETNLYWQERARALAPAGQEAPAPRGLVAQYKLTESQATSVALWAYIAELRGAIDRLAAYEPSIDEHLALRGALGDLIARVRRAADAPVPKGGADAVAALSAPRQGEPT